MNEMMIVKEQLVAWRRHFHMHPETSGMEKETSDYLAGALAAMGLPVTRNLAGHGLVAELIGDPQGKCAALRADMDALPVSELNECSYRSQAPGKMHACGHDAHMAILLGAARCLSENPPRGTVKFIFQPKEEKPPGGAREMVLAGVLDDPRVDGIFGLHVSPALPAGKIAVKDGAMMAIADDFTLTIRGKGGHGANPHLATDTILIAAQTVQALQNIVARRVDAAEAVVLSLGTIHGGTAQNIIPDEVVMTGTLRTLDIALRDRMIVMIKETVGGITSAWGADYRLDYLYGYPPVINCPDMNRIVLETARTIPDLQIEIMSKPLMIGEDFAYYGAQVPASFFLLGSGGAGENYSLHHARFNVDEACLAIGVEMMAGCVRRMIG